ncbi:hypothetical protein TNCV_3721281 [Trichonephila clavipes]|nr:hypothetical protein TNCV_3721281 [Trichonephila clavipes]
MLDFYLLVLGRYFISLLRPIGNQWKCFPIYNLGPFRVYMFPRGNKLPYCSSIRPIMKYSSLVWASAANTAMIKIDSIQYGALEIINETKSSTNNSKTDLKRRHFSLDSSPQLNLQIRSEATMKITSLEKLLTIGRD